MTLRSNWLVIACLSSLAWLAGCNEVANPDGVDDFCFDTDGDGYGVNCGPGPDCNEEDTELHTSWDVFTDADGDGIGLTVVNQVCGGSTIPDGYSETLGDCDDTDASLFNDGVAYIDSDGDGHGAGDLVSVCMGDELIEGYADTTGDCDDNEATVWVEGVGFTDVDGDGVGVGDPVTLCIGDELPDGFAGEAGDCDDGDDAFGVSCNPCTDDDEDGYGVGCEAGPDCDDENDEVHSEALIYADQDGDTYTGDEVVLACIGDEAPDGFTLLANGNDCDDDDDDVYQALFGFVDSDGDGVGSADSGFACSGESLADGYADATGDCDDADETVQQRLLGYPDRDGDGAGFGEPQLVCSGEELPEAFADNGNDCDDDDETIIECPTCIDEDTDGYGLGCESGADCNDDDINVFTNTLLYPDLDKDGYTTSDPEIYCIGSEVPVGFAVEPNGIDCNDGEISVFQELLGYPNGDGDQRGAGDPLMVCSGDELSDAFSEVGGDCDNGDSDVWRLLGGYVNNDTDDIGAGELIQVCSGDDLPDGYSTETGDCDDNDGELYDLLYGYANGDTDDVGSGDLLQICSGDELPDGFVEDGGDCNDGNGDVYQNLSGYVNNDTDDYGTGNLLDVCSGEGLPEGFSAEGGDCNDGDGDVYQNLSGYVNNDGDDYGTGNLLTICSGEALPEGFIDTPGDCNDGNGDVHTELAGYVNNDTDDYGTGDLLTLCTDGELPDGFASNPGDCNDENGDVYRLLPGYVNNDSDDYGTGGLLDVCSGEGLPDGFGSQPGDCNDANGDIWQLLPGYVNNDSDDYGVGALLNICSGESLPDGFGSQPGDCDDSNGDLFMNRPGYVNNDGDELGAGALLTVCSGGEGLPDGFAALPGDCNDNNINVWQELAGYVNNDGDELGAGQRLQVCSGEGLPDGYAEGAGDCNDNNIEVWQNLTGYVDEDLDRVGAGAQVIVCSGEELPEGYGVASTDCDDRNITVWQLVDLYPDVDEDTYGGVMETLCIGEEPPAPYIERGGDCNDDDSDIWSTCDTCIDPDGDGYYNECDAWDHHEGPDCRPDHDDAWAYMEVLRDWDGDGAPGESMSVICTGDSAPAGYVDLSQLQGEDDLDCDDFSAEVWTVAVIAMDADGDGYISGDVQFPFCTGDTLPEGIVLMTDDMMEDCHDGDPLRHTWADFFRDTDGDGYTVAEATELCAGEETPSYYRDTASDTPDCADWDPDAHPGGFDIPGDGVDSDCVGGDLAPEPGDGLFVTVEGSDGGDGTPEAPITLAEALAELGTLPEGTRIYMAEGDYKITEGYEFLSNAVFGGFTSDFGAMGGETRLAFTHAEWWFNGSSALANVTMEHLTDNRGLVVSGGSFRGDGVTVRHIEEASGMTVHLSGEESSLGLYDSALEATSHAILAGAGTLVRVVDSKITGQADGALFGVNNSLGRSTVIGSTIDLGGTVIFAVVSDNSVIIDTTISGHGPETLYRAEALTGSGTAYLEGVDIQFSQSDSTQVFGGELDGLQLRDVEIALCATSGAFAAVARAANVWGEEVDVSVYDGRVGNQGHCNAVEGSGDRTEFETFEGIVATGESFFLGDSTLLSAAAESATATIDLEVGEATVFGTDIETPITSDDYSTGMDIEAQSLMLVDSTVRGTGSSDDLTGLYFDGEELFAVLNTFNLSGSGDDTYGIETTDDDYTLTDVFISINWFYIESRGRDREVEVETIGLDEEPPFYDYTCRGVDLDDGDADNPARAEFMLNQLELNCEERVWLIEDEELVAEVPVLVEYEGGSYDFTMTVDMEAYGLDVGEWIDIDVLHNYVTTEVEDEGPEPEELMLGDMYAFEFDGYNNARVVGNAVSIADSDDLSFLYVDQDEDEDGWMDGVIANNWFIGESEDEVDGIRIKGDLLVSRNVAFVTEGDNLDVLDINGGNVDVVANLFAFDQSESYADVVDIDGGRVLLQGNILWAGTAATGETSTIDVDGMGINVTVLNNTMFSGNLVEGDEDGVSGLEIEVTSDEGSIPPTQAVIANNIILLGESDDRAVPRVITLTAEESDVVDDPTIIFQNNLVDGAEDFVYVADNTLDGDNELLVQSLVGFEGCLWQNCSSVSGTLVGDPMFLDGSFGNSVLSENSPAIDAGLNLDLVGGDDSYLPFWNGDIGYGDGVDIGAYEWMAGEISIDLQPPRTFLID